VLLGIGAAMAAGGAIAALGFGYGLYAANAQVAEPTSDWEMRGQAALLGLGMGVGAVVSAAVLVAGGALAATALLSGDE
jgi:hypothetical protein